MIIGVDFDNTIVCYDELLHKISLRKGFIPSNIPHAKDAIRNYLRKCGKENVWIELQGAIYGPGILEAKPFKGVLDFFMHCKKNKIKVYIISHKTLHPFLGSKHSLHEFAHKWLEKYGFYDSRKIGLPKNRVFFELKKEDKLKRIIKQQCTHFIDDLPEFLSEKGFPSGIARFLFDPNSQYENIEGVEHIKSWEDILEKVK